MWMESIWITSGVLCKHTVPYSEAEALACQFHGKRVTCVTFAHASLP